MIASPTLLIDEQKCRANIRRMAEKARSHNLEFRPHFKTHQSADIAEWFKDEGVTGITVSSVQMAGYFADHGWKDITIAFPVNIREIDQINKLANELDLTLLISDSESIPKLEKKLLSTVGVFIEIDTGSHRSGFRVSDPEEIDRLLSNLKNTAKLNCKGFYSHPGHSYSSRSKEEILNVHEDVLEQLALLKSRYDFSSEGFSICIGDTPCCSAADDFDVIDQISPGNFVFYDVMQAEIGSCSIEDIAVALACPVTAKYPSRNEIVIYGGAIHLSNERLGSNSTTHFGLPVTLRDQGWEVNENNGYVKSLSQEHGIVRCSDKFMNSVSIGDLIAVLPVHSCLTADLMSGYLTLKDKTLNHIRNCRYGGNFAEMTANTTGDR